LHTLPKEHRDQVVALLARIPGFEGTTGRRRLLSTTWPTSSTDSPQPRDRDIESGWEDVIAGISRLPPGQSVDLLRALLTNIDNLIGHAELSEAIASTGRRLAELATQRSFPLFVARIGLETDAQDDNGIFVIDRVFVPPVQYSQARAILERDRVVFLLGDPHMGKTYCALQLLWEKFREGYEPYWLRSPLELKLLEPNSRSPIPRHSVIYIEDPFGRISPVDDPDAIYGQLRRLFVDAGDRDLLIVVTSRTVVLQAAIADRLREYIVTLSQQLLLDTSYDGAALLDITRRYIDVYEPRWATHGVDEMAQSISAELPAPHNIQEFVLATRALEDPAEARRRLQDFKDVVTQYVTMLKRLEDWTATALLIVSASSGQNMSLQHLTALYDVLNPQHPPYRSFEAALRELHYHLTFSANHQPTVRHPSIEEAVESLIRQREPLMEATWLLVEACDGHAGVQHASVAIGLLTRFADRWAEAPGRLERLERYFDHSNLDVRAASRRQALNQFAELRAEAARRIADLALNAWGDRFLLQLILSPSQLDDERCERLAARLAISRDAQTKYHLAHHLRELRPGTAREISPALIADSDGLVVRRAIYEATVLFSTDPDLLPRLREAVARLPSRHRRWLAGMAVNSVAMQELLGSVR
jgi:hypothetical protein